MLTCGEACIVELRYCVSSVLACWHAILATEEHSSHCHGCEKQSAADGAHHAFDGLWQPGWHPIVDQGARVREAWPPAAEMAQERDSSLFPSAASEGCLQAGA